MQSLPKLVRIRVNPKQESRIRHSRDPPRGVPPPVSHGGQGCGSRGTRATPPPECGRRIWSILRQPHSSLVNRQRVCPPECSSTE